MTEKERKRLYQSDLTPETPLCVNCQHFYQHYNVNGQEVQCGHCDSPRIKTRMPYETCDHFQRKSANRKSIGK